MSEESEEIRAVREIVRNWNSCPICGEEVYHDGAGNVHHQKRYYEHVEGEL